MQIRRNGTILLLTALLLAAGPQSAPGKKRPKLNGSYEVNVKGDWTGSGKVSIGSQNVNFKIKATDLAGNTIQIHCPGMDMNDEGRFTGTADVNGRVVRVNGRVDDPFGKGTPRIVGWILDSTNYEYARFVGSRKGD